MNLNLYDADLHIQRQKELAQAAADSYKYTRFLERRGLRDRYHDALVATGGVLIALGTRLQGQIDELAAAAPELGEPLSAGSQSAPI